MSELNSTNTSVANSISTCGAPNASIVGAESICCSGVSGCGMECDGEGRGELLVKRWGYRTDCCWYTSRVPNASNAAGAESTL